MTPSPSCDKSVLAVVCLVSEQHLTGNIYGCAHTIHTLVNLCNMGIEPMQCVTHINGIDMLVYVHTIHGALFEHVRSPLLIYVRHRYQWTQHSAIVVLHSKPLMQQTKCPQCHSYTRKGKGGMGGREKGDLKRERGVKKEKGCGGGEGWSISLDLRRRRTICHTFRIFTFW